MHLPKYGQATPGVPLRTITELAEEFGVSREKLSSLLRWRNGPKPRQKFGGGYTHNNTWYVPGDVRKWWKEINA